MVVWCTVVRWCTVARWWYGVLLLGGGMVYCCYVLVWCTVVRWCTVARWWYGVLLLGGRMVFCCGRCGLLDLYLMRKYQTEA